MPRLDLAAQSFRQTTLGAIAAWLPWESELSELAVHNPDFASAVAVVIDGDLDAGDHNIDLDNLFPDDLDRPLPFLLLIRGSVRARAVLNTDFDGGTHLVVHGDLHADFLITIDQETFVGGALQLGRAWWGLGEAGRLMVRGEISAPALIADGCRIDDERIQLRHGVTTTAFLSRRDTDFLPRAHVGCVLAADYIDDSDDFDDVPDGFVDWVRPVDILDALGDGIDPFAGPITDPTVDLFIPDPDLVALSAPEVLHRFAAEVSPHSMTAVLLHALVQADCLSYDDDLIDEERKYSVRPADADDPARLTIMRTISDPQQIYRFHHFEARESSSGAMHIELLTQEALGMQYHSHPVPHHHIDHYRDAITCFRRLLAFLDEKR